MSHQLLESFQQSSRFDYLFYLFSRDKRSKKVWIARITDFYTKKTIRIKFFKKKNYKTKNEYKYIDVIKDE